MIENITSALRPLFKKKEEKSDKKNQKRKESEGESEILKYYDDSKRNKLNDEKYKIKLSIENENNLKKFIKDINQISYYQSKDIYFKLCSIKDFTIIEVRNRKTDSFIRKLSVNDFYNFFAKKSVIDKKTNAKGALVDISW